MKAKHVKRSRVPAYPTKLQILANPKLLEQNIPPAWKTGLMAGAVSVFLAANTLGCSSDKPSSQKPSPVENTGSIVAPIFEHGDGRGGSGCVSVVPPVFLSEEEALQVISEELSKQGIELSERNAQWDVVIPRRYRKYNRETQENDAVEDYDRGKPLNVDAIDTERKIAVEFVSRSEHDDLGGFTFPPGVSASAKSYDFKETAAFLAKRVREEKKEGIYFGAFYDPFHYADFKPVRGTRSEEMRRLREKAIQKARENSIRLLREQVKDFVDWLKAQGAI